MSSIDDYLKSLIQLEKNLESNLIEILKDKESFIVGLIKNRLYQKGIDADGNKILPDYKPSTIIRKKEDGQRTSHVTLRDTGGFYAGIFLDIQDLIVKADSSDSKTSSLKNKYGEGILGFTKDEQEFIIQTIIEPEINKIINSLPRNIDL